MDDGYALLAEQHREIEARLQGLVRDQELPLVRELAELLARHARGEEAALYPALRRYVDGGDDLADRAVEQQSKLATVLAELDDAPDDAPDRLGDLLDEITHAVAEHVELLEAEVFPEMRACDVDGAQLAASLAAADPSVAG